MRKSLLIYAVPAVLIVVSPLLPDSGHDSRDVPFMKNLGPNVLPIAFWLTAIIFVTRCIVSLANRRHASQQGFEVIVGAARPSNAENAAAMNGSINSQAGPRGG